MSVCQEQFYLIGVDEHSQGRDFARLTFRTTRGDFSAILRHRAGMKSAVILLGGEKGGLAGPSAIYPELAEDLYQNGFATMTVESRNAADCVQSTIDTLLTVQYLDDEGISDIVIVGWSAGAATAMAAGALANDVRGVAAISYGEIADNCIHRLKDKPILIIQGDADIMSSVDSLRKICPRPCDMRKLVTYPKTNHDMAESRDLLMADLKHWIQNTLHGSLVMA